MTIIDGGSTATGGTTTCTSSLGDRIFDVSDSISAIFEGITIKGGNTIYTGGGIDAESIIVENSTISGNTASYGGGMYVETFSIFTIADSTIAKNTGGGIDLTSYSSLEIKNTILAKNLSSTSRPTNCTIDFTSTATSLGHNFFTPVNCPISPAIGDITDGLKLSLGALSDNGGPTQTMALSPNSAAVNTGSCTVVTDQRGQLRDAFCDMGAYEDVGKFCGDAHISETEECDDGNNTNGDGCSEICERELHEKPNLPPIANAGPDQTLEPFDQMILLVPLEATAYDPDGDALIYSWTLLGYPLGSHVPTHVGTGASIYFATDRLGEYVIVLKVTDTYGNYDTDLVKITLEY